jgi:putative membrane protein
VNERRILIDGNAMPRKCDEMCNLLPGFAVAAVGVSFFVIVESDSLSAFGPLTSHMSWHILLMNVLAPLLALSMLRHASAPGGILSGQPLAAASLAQIAALWGAHAPPVLSMAMVAPAAHTVVQASLFASSLWFWWAVFAQSRRGLWRSLFALLVTGKLFCLLGALLVFAPRVLYPGVTGLHSVAAHDGLSSLADQQLAGLLMLVACPLSYVLAATVLAARWLRALAANGTRPGSCSSAAHISG